MRRLVADVLQVAQLHGQLGAPRVVVDELAEDLGGGHQVLADAVNSG